MDGQNEAAVILGMQGSYHPLTQLVCAYLFPTGAVLGLMLPPPFLKPYVLHPQRIRFTL